MLIEIKIRSKYGSETFVHAEFDKESGTDLSDIQALISVIEMHDNLWRSERDKKSKSNKEVQGADVSE